MLKGFLANIKLITRITIFVSAYEKNCNKTFVDEKKRLQKSVVMSFLLLFLHYRRLELLSVPWEGAASYHHSVQFLLLSRDYLHRRDV
nr:MAG TPA: hypothetical protein [Caudoviricetes sp.]